MKKVAIVTGSSRGIGAAIAKVLAREYAVCINYVSAKEKAQKLAEEICVSGGEALALQADMSSETQILNLFATVDQKLGPLAVLINNAGISGGVSEVEHISLELLQQVFATNVFGTFIACREAIKRMKKYSGGNIVNISSEAAKFGGNKISHYAASKAAINTMTIGLARELAPHNIRVNTVSPGVIETDIHLHSAPERISHLLKSIPLGRMGQDYEVAEVVKWLVSKEASYVSGAIIPVTGSR